MELDCTRPPTAWGDHRWHTALVEQRHQDLLLSVYEAEASWSAQDGQQRTFLLIHTGAMQSHVDHPGWDPAWPAPSEHTIDDLAELGLLRVEPSDNKQRTFTLSMKGRELGAHMHRRSQAS